MVISVQDVLPSTGGNFVVDDNVAACEKLRAFSRENYEQC